MTGIDDIGDLTITDIFGGIKIQWQAYSIEVFGTNVNSATIDSSDFIF